MDKDDYAAQYAKQYSGDEWFEQVMVDVRARRVMESIATYAPARLLEVGCGMVPLFQRLNTFSRVTIIEPCHVFVEAAREASAGRKDVEIIEGFLEEVVAEKDLGEFDMIVVSSLLHEVADPAALLRAVHSACTDTSVAHFNVPNVRSFHRLLALEMGIIEDLFERSQMEQRFQRTTRYDGKTFRQALENGGFEIIGFGTYFVKPFSHRQMERLFIDGILDRSALAAFERMTKYLPDLGAEMYADVRRRS